MEECYEWTQLENEIMFVTELERIAVATDTLTAGLPGRLFYYVLINA